MLKKSSFLICAVAMIFGLTACNPGTTVNDLSSANSQAAPSQPASVPASEPASVPASVPASQPASTPASTPASQPAPGSSKVDSSAPISSNPGSSAPASSAPASSAPASSAADETKYLVSQEYWTANITQGGFFGANHNLTMRMTMTNDAGSAQTGSLANQNGTLYLNIISGEEHIEMYIQPLEDMTYDLYSQNEGKWTKMNVPATYAAYLAMSYASFINPWPYSDFTYNSATHAYEKASDTLTVEGETILLTDIAFKFEDSKLVSLTYKANQGADQYDFSLTVSNWGTTTVTLPEVSTDISVMAILLSESMISMKVGDNKEITATVYPENATNKEVTWSLSSNIAHIDYFSSDHNKINIKAEQKGTVILTAAIGSVTATCTIVIEDNNGGGDTPVVATKITITQDNLNMTVGESTTLTATVYPADAVNKLVHWSPDKKGVVDVVVFGENNSQATITAIGAGTCHVTAVVSANVEAICTVTVTGGTNPTVNPTSISLSPTSLNMKVNETEALVATILPENATNKEVTWSTNSDVVEITPNAADSRKASVKALKEGSATVSAACGNGLVATCAVTVAKDEPVSITDALVGVTLKYKAFVGPTDYGEETLTSAQVDALMGDVRLALFEGTKNDDNIWENCAFEYYHETSPMKGAYLGTFSSSDGSAYGRVDRYYNFTTSKFSFGRGIPYRNIVSLYDGMRLTYINEENVEWYQMDGYTITVGMYIMQGYLMDENGVVSGKGMAIFEKVNDSPVHLSNIPADYSEPDISAVVNDKLFTYTGYQTSDPNFIANGKYHAEENGATVAFFEDGTFEYHLYYEASASSYTAFESERIYRGTFEVDYSNDEEDALFGEDIYCITLRAVDVIKDDQATNLTFVYFDFYYSVSTHVLTRSRENLSAYTEEGSTQSASMLFNFALSNEKPERYETPVYDNWDATALSEALAEVGYTDVLPKMDNVKAFEIRDSGVDSFVIMCTFANSALATEMNESYARVIEETFIPIRQYDSAAGDYVLYRFSPNYQYKVEWHIVDSNYIQITISNGEPAYPTADISSYLRGKGYTDTLPEVKVSGASGYEFSADADALYINIASDKVNDAAQDVIAILLEEHFTLKQALGYNFYVSPNNQFAVYFCSQTNGFGLAFVNASNIPDTTFPESKLSAYLTGVTDTYPDLTYDGVATYAYDGPSGSYYDAYVTVYFDSYLTESQFKEELYPSLVDLLLNNGYTLYKYVTIATADGGSKTYQNIFVSEHSQIGIRIVASASSAWDEENNQIVVYYQYSFSFVNFLTYRITDSDDGLPHLDSIAVTGYLSEYNVGDEISVSDIECVAYYTNGGEPQVVTPTITDAPDMSTEGRKAVTVSYTEGGITKEATYYITVYKPVQLVNYTYQNVDTFDIFDASAEFMIWAWGGQYGKGQWVEIDSINRTNKLFNFALSSDCEGFVIVRLNPEDLPTDSDVWGVTAWNQTGTLTPIVLEEGYVTFAFVNNGGN